ncbi:hypothetical protein [Azohydromonas sediminis]|uniref:hypothetical protein n=1 Tax=Azohydromonas sediminis TaxID=2259674 RepID=UPI000E65489D|nr:hypothetical protein [Azohydromonas sediminis]
MNTNPAITDNDFHASIQALGTQLAHLVLKELVLRMQTKPSAELLAIARQALSDFGLTGQPLDEKDHKKLVKLRKQVIGTLVESVGPGCSAAMLQEARRFLADEGLSGQLGHQLSAGQVRALLSEAASVPFKQ